MIRATGIFLCALASPVQAGASFSGYLKSYAMALDADDLFGSGRVYQSRNTGRFMVDYFGKRALFQVHYEVSPVLVSRNLSAGGSTLNPVGGGYRLTDLQGSLDDDGKGKNRLYQNLDRLNAQINADVGDLTIGRQAISFGAARFISPTDVFLPFDVRTFDTEYRTGVDAIRFQRPWGDLGEVDLGIVLGEKADRETSAAFLQLRQNHAGKDLNFALIEYAEQTLVGVGVQSELADFGFWFEVARVDGTEDYVRVSVGLDHAWTENVFGMVEYHHNGAGSDRPEDYPALPGTLPYQGGGIFLLGENYLIPSLSVLVTPLWTIAGQAVVNLDDQSVFMSMTAEYNLAENLYMDFGIYRFIGDDLSVDAAGMPVFGSEYGSNPDTLYTSLRWYF